MHRLLNPETLLKAYANGVFPMADEDGRIVWFCPEPRAVIELDHFRVSRTLRQLYRQGKFELTVNQAFEPVMRGCARRPEGTWISEDIVECYVRLHEQGYAHSVEAWLGEKLAGGLYGVALGGLFCGESMFHEVRDASKVALVHLVERMVERGFQLLDIQFMTDHLARFGAETISRGEYLQRLPSMISQSCRFT